MEKIRFLFALKRWALAAAVVFVGALSDIRAAVRQDGITPLEKAYALDAKPAAQRDAAAVAAAYRTAADSGDAYGHFRLGYLYEKGDGVPQDFAAAKNHYQAAVDAGLEEARLRLAVCYLEGWGAQQDRAAFAREVQLAAEADYAPAEQILSALYFIGFGVSRDLPAAVKWLERATAQNVASAQVTMGNYLEQAQHHALQPDLTLVRSWYELSAQQEYSAAYIAMARSFLTGQRSTRNWELGQKWLQAATESGDFAAPCVLAYCELLHVDAPQHDAAKARAWLLLARDRGNPMAGEILGLERLGVPLDDAARSVLNRPFQERYVDATAVTMQRNSTPGNSVPIIYHVVKPIYPVGLRVMREEGKVMLDFIVTTEGVVKNAKVVETTHVGFNDAAIEAVSQWRFHPARKNGQAVTAHMRVPVIFDLKDNQINTVDTLLSDAHMLAEGLGVQAAADAKDIRGMAQFAGHVELPTTADGTQPARGSWGILLFVVDNEGVAKRGYVLTAQPDNVGAPVLAHAMKQRFKPYVENDVPTSASLVMTYRYGEFDDRVFK